MKRQVVDWPGLVPLDMEQRQAEARESMLMIPRQQACSRGIADDSVHEASCVSYPYLMQPNVHKSAAPFFASAAFVLLGLFSSNKIISTSSFFILCLN